MMAFKTLFQLRLKRQLQYRGAAFAGVFTQLFFGLVMVMVYLAFFESTDQVMPMTLSQTVTYVWLGQAFLGMLPWNGDREVQKMIRDGQVAYELVRPINLYYYWYFKMLATRLGNVLLRAIPLWLLIGFLPKDMRPLQAASLGGLLAFAFSMVGALILGISLTNIITITTLLTIGDGMDRLFPALVTLCSGLVIPLAYFPDWSQPIFRILPFSGLTDQPYQFYLGMMAPSRLPQVLAHQLVWTILLIAIGQGILRAATKSVVIQGG